MKRLKSILALVLLLAFLASPIAVLASDISAARYYGTIIVSNNSTATTNVAVNCIISTEALIDGGYLNSSANNCVVRSSAGADLPFMPSANNSYPWCIWVPSIGENSHLSDILYTANSTGGEIRYFPATTGMISTDNTTLEPGDNFTIEQKGWWNTDAGNNKRAVYKPIGFRTFVSPTVSENITSEIGARGLDFVRANSDWVSIPDSDDFSFVTAGVDEPFSIVAWINTDDVTDSWLVVKWAAAKNEWSLYFDASDKLTFKMFSNDGTKTIGRETVALTAYQGQFVHLVGTYDGTEASGGIDIYVNAAVADAADENSGVYAGMANNSAGVELGSRDGGGSVFYDGQMAEVKIYSVELTPTEVTADFHGIHKSTDLVAWYELEEGTGNPTDSSGNSHDATANTADWFDNTVSVTATSVESGEHTVTTTANTTHMWIDVDGDTKDTVALGGASIPDNASDWASCQNDVMRYLEYQDIEIDGVEQQRIEWEYDDTTFTDLSGQSHDATPTFRTTSSDADVSAVFTDFLPVSEAKAPAYALEDAPAFIETVPTIVSTWVVTPEAGVFPLAGVIRAIASATDTPAQLPLLVTAAFVILACSLAISATMRRYGSGSLIVKSLVITALMGVFIALGNFGIDFWMLVVFLIMAVALAMASRHTAWQ